MVMPKILFFMCYNQKIDIDKVWAQAHHLLKSGFKFTLTKEEIDYSEKNNQEIYMKTTSSDIDTSLSFTKKWI